MWLSPSSVCGDRPRIGDGDWVTQLIPGVQKEFAWELS